MGHRPRGLQRGRRRLGVLPHDHARSRAYRWGEDGLAGFCDIEQRLASGSPCGTDATRSSRSAVRADRQGNHGEDAKEYWWYLDAVPSHAWNRWRYHYPQAAFPYEDLIAENGRRGQARARVRTARHRGLRRGPLLGRRSRYAKADPPRRADEGPGHQRRPGRGDTPRPADRVVPQHLVVGRRRAERRSLSCAGARALVRIDHPFFGELELLAGSGPDGARTDVAVLRQRDERRAVLRRRRRLAVAEGRHQRPGRRRCAHGQPAAAGHQGGVLVSTRPLRQARLSSCACDCGQGAAPDARRPAGRGFDAVVALAQAEADEFYADLTPTDGTADEALVMRQAFAGMLWSKQLYYYDVERWLDGDPAQPPPPPARLAGATCAGATSTPSTSCRCPTSGSTRGLRRGTWPFTASRWPTSIPAFAKYQLLLLCREWFQHPNGALPAYEWDFGDVNPPVQAWAALEVFAIDGGTRLRLSAPDFRQAAGQLHLVGQP